MKPALISEIEKLLGIDLHEAPARGDDPVSGVMPVKAGQPFRYALHDGHVAGLNLAGAKLNDKKWQAIRALKGFDPERIEALNLRQNRLLTSPVEGLTGLRWLDLCENALKEVRIPPRTVKGLEHVWLYKNIQLAIPPPEIVRRGNASILQYLKSLDKGRRLFEAKMLILGEGGAGKTSLARRLIHRTAAMPGENESTRGIDILRYEFQTPAGDTFLLKLWDFAGQDIYHATHQFFLTKRSLYILVDNTRFTPTDLPDNTFFYWFRIAELYGDNSPLLLVQNEVADRSKDINFKGYTESFGFLKARYQVNIDSNRGMDELAKAVAEYAMGLPHVGEVWSETWLKARRALEMLSEQRDYIDYETFVQTLSNEGVTEEEEAKVLGGFLHDLGVILHFKDDAALHDLIILRNQWATDAVYKVLDHQQVKNRFGQFTGNDIDSIWSDVKYKFRKKELLALMERFELCYPLEGTPEPTWLATQLLPEEAPNIPWDHYHNHVVRYDFTFMPKGLIPRYIVRNNQYVSNIGYAWKYGVEMTCGQTVAKITATYATGTIEIRVNNKGDYRTFLARLVDDMDQLLASFGDKLKVEKMLPCHCEQCICDTEPHFFKYSALQRRKEVLKKETIECEKSGIDVEVKTYLDNLFGKNLKMKKIFISYSHKDEAAKERLLVHLKLLQRQGKITPWNDRLIRPGEEWDAAIKQELNEADIVLILLSPDAIASDYIWNIEIETAMTRHKNKEAQVVPIILLPCEWAHTPVKGLQGLPRDGKPVSSFPEPEVAWAKIAEEIRALVG